MPNQRRTTGTVDSLSMGHPCFVARCFVCGWKGEQRQFTSRAETDLRVHDCTTDQPIPESGDTL